MKSLTPSLRPLILEMLDDLKTYTVAAPLLAETYGADSDEVNTHMDSLEALTASIADRICALLEANRA